MRTTFAIGFALGALLFAGVPHAEPADTSRHFEGEVVKLDPAKRTLVLKGVGEAGSGAALYTFALKTDAEITAKGQKKQLGDLAPGDRVVVTYREARGFEMVSRVDIVQKSRPVSTAPRRPTD